jgi:hypothetical protein
LQAEWLAQSAAALAAARLRSDPQYAGETWAAAAADLESRKPGAATISVAPADDESQRRVAIEVHYPDDPVTRTRVVKTLVLDAAPGDSPSP